MKKYMDLKPKVEDLKDLEILDPLEEILTLEKDLNNLRAKIDPEPEIVQLFHKLNEKAKAIGAHLSENPPMFPNIEEGEMLPNEDVIECLNSFIESMTEEIDVRKEKVEELRNEANNLLTRLGIKPSTDHQRFILFFEDVFSKKLLKGLLKFVNSLKNQVFFAEAERQALCLEIESLCKSLGKPIGEFPIDISTSTLQILKAKSAQLKRLMDSNIEAAVSNTVSNINQLKTHLLISQMTRKPEFANEESLQLLQNEILELKRYHEENKEIIQLVRKRWEDRKTLFELENELQGLESNSNTSSNYESRIQNLKEAIAKAEEILLTWGGKILGFTIPQLMEKENNNISIKKENIKFLKKMKYQRDEPDNAIEIIDLESDQSDQTSSITKKRKTIKKDPGYKEKVQKRIKNVKKIKSEPLSPPSSNHDPMEEVLELEKAILLKRAKNIKINTVKAEQEHSIEIKTEIDEESLTNKKSKPFLWKDDVRILQIIGASKWHDYTDDDAMWEEMCEDDSIFPERKPSALKRRFHVGILENLSAYGLPIEELELYDFGSKKIKNQKIEMPPLNLDYENYKLN